MSVHDTKLRGVRAHGRFVALVLLLATPRRYLCWRYLSLIAACAVPALLVVARRRTLYM